MKKIIFLKTLIIISQTIDILTHNYDQLIMSPPLFENDTPRNYPDNQIDSNYKFIQDEYVLIPTPIDQNSYNQLKQDNNGYVINNPNFIDKNEVMLPNNYASLVNNTLGNLMQSNVKNFEEIANSNDPNKIQTFFNLQESDYNKYFDAINKMEYEKIFKSLNHNDEQTIYNQMASTNIDYGNLLNSTNIMINLPQEKKDIETNYANFFNEMYLFLI
jgi:hypothetical protein